LTALAPAVCDGADVARRWSATGLQLHAQGSTNMSLSLLVVIVLILLLIGALPTWGYSRSWGYRPTGGIGLILLIVLVLWLLGMFS
jgi:hypothetical protein